MKMRALVNLHYPASQTVRNKIRAATARGWIIPYGERGRIVDVGIGEEVNVPADLAQGWLDNRYAEGLTEEGDGAEEIADAKEG